MRRCRRTSRPGSGRNWRSWNRPPHQARERRDKLRRIVQTGDHPKIFDPQRPRLLAVLDIDLVQRFDVIGYERDRNHDDLFAPFFREPLDGFVHGRPQPFRSPHLALVAQVFPAAPGAALPDRLHSGLDLPLIGIALLDHRHGNAVRAEDVIRAVDGHKVDCLHHGIEVKLIQMKFFDGVHPRIPTVDVELAPPFVEAAAGGGLGILRIERQQHHVVRPVLLECGDRLLGERAPITHRHNHPRVARGPESLLQRGGLPHGVFQDGALAADLGVVVGHVFRARRGDEAGQRLARNAGEWKIDDVRIGEKVIEERLDGLERIRTSQLKQHDPQFHYTSNSLSFMSWCQGMARRKSVDTSATAMAIVLLVPLGLYGQTSSCSNTATYSTCEIVFEAPDAAAHPNPYATVDLSILFRSPRQRSYELPAYWDGGRRMVVRFSPVEAGKWDYLVKSNVAAWDGKTGSLNAAASDSKGFVHPAAMHHWAYTEKANGLDQGHLWLGASEPRFAFVDDAAARTLADARAADQFTHVRVPLMGEGSDPFLFQGPDTPNTAFFQRLDGRLRYLNEKGIIADIVPFRSTADMAKLLPTAEQRRRFARYLAGRYAAMNVTWEAVAQFEDAPDSRFVLKDFGTALKQADPYQHPRTVGAKLTSSPLLDDGWIDFVASSSADDDLGAVEHQLYPAPFVSVDSLAAGGDAAAYRRRLWNATMNGQTASLAVPAGG